MFPLIRAVRLTASFSLCCFAAALAILATINSEHRAEKSPRYAAVPQSEAGGLDALEAQWAARLSYPTGKFDPWWVRAAAVQDAAVTRSIPSGQHAAQFSLANGRAVALSISGFTSLGPAPLKTTGCVACYDFGNAAGRVNAIAVDPATASNNGTITAYLATVGGGIWKTTNCCTGLTSWNVVTDDPLLSTTSIDALAIDPNDHNAIYAGTGDLSFGSFSMGSQGILKSTDAGATWKLLAPQIFGAALPQPAGKFPQYQAVGKVRVDPNNNNRVVAGTKTGMYVSYDAGASWTGPCTTNSYSSQRQDITGLELTDMGGGVTRILAAVGVRGFATTVQYNLDQNGANGIYSGTMPASGCPSDFTLISRSTNGFIFGNAVTGSPYATGDILNPGTGSPYGGVGVGNQLGRVDIAVAPASPNYIYAQVQSIAPNDNASCGRKAGCQLGVWASIDGGASWKFVQGSAGGSLMSCDGTSGDYNQNWYDQAIAIDPDDPDRIFIGTYDIWLARRDGTSFYDLTCGYDYASAPVHVDQHALTFVNRGSSKLLLSGNDGGIFGSTDSDNATIGGTRNTWFNMDGGLNTIEFYSGDISGNFANASSSSAIGGSQDNGTTAVSFSASPTGPAQWQEAVGGDGFGARIDPIGSVNGLVYFSAGNDGVLRRCDYNCTNPNGGWSTVTGGWRSDTKSAILPFDLFHGGIAGGDDCAAGPVAGCGHLLAGTTRVWETTSSGSKNTPSGFAWYVTNNPTIQNMTKQALGDRSFINQVKYSPKYQSVAIAGTNDGNAWIGFNLGTGLAAQAMWVDVTGGNAILPNRPVLGIALDPSSSAANLPTGYAAIGGFNANTPNTAGHVFQVTCTANCSSFTWENKSGNLPDIPVNSIIVNPKYPQQVFAGTDFGLYYSDDISAAAPVWNKFTQGLPNTMIWDMQIDRGATTLSVWTRGRGAFVWPLPSGAVPKPSAPPPHTLNISTRLDVGTGESRAIGGFIVSGSSPKRILLRGIGASLAQAGVNDALVDPVLELHGPDDALISSNDNWQDSDAAAISATGIPPADGRESALIATVAPGNYTAIMSGKDGATGVGLVEAYDLDGSGAPSRLANISTRGVVQTGGKVVIGGFILGNGQTGADILVRGLGPSLVTRGVTSALDDPTLTLADSQGSLIMRDDNWQDDPAQAQRISGSGIPPGDAREAAIATSLPPGAYTTILAGKSDSTGVGIVEIYNLSQ